jgi:acetyl-CoA/propionyl-CoA carboxylase biotin carboxyl carrier protein
MRTSIARGVDGAAAGTRTHDRLVGVEIDGRAFQVRLEMQEPAWTPLARRHRERGSGLAAGLSGAVLSPMQGTVLKIEVSDGQEVEAGSVLCLIEAMKMENEIHAPVTGVVESVVVTPGQQVASGQLLCVVRAGADAAAES